MEPNAILALISDLYGQVVALTQVNQDLQQKLAAASAPSSNEG